MRYARVDLLLALIPLLAIGCETARIPTAGEVAVLNELQPLNRRVNAMERQVGDKPDRYELAESAQKLDQRMSERVSRVETESRTAASDLRTELTAVRSSLKTQASAVTEIERRLGLDEELGGLEPANQPILSQLRSELAGVRNLVESQTATIGGLEGRLEAVERRGRIAPTSSQAGQAAGETQRVSTRIRSDMVLTQIKREVASARGLAPGQIEHIEVAGFPSGSADLQPILASDPRAREQLQALRRLIREERVEVIAIAAFEDTSPCRRPDDERCNTVGMRRGLVTATYLDAPRGVVEAREPTDRWGAPAANRRVIVFYARKDPGSARPLGRSAPALSATPSQ